MTRRKILYFSLAFLLGPLNLVSQNALAANLKFTAQVQLSPISQLPANITFVPEGDVGSSIDQVRAMLVLDGELLAIKLQKDSQPKTRNEGPEFRGVFPTPNETLTYQFQIMYKNGKAELTNRFETLPGCSGYRIEDEVDRETKILMLSQQQKKRLEIARDLLRLEKKRIDEQ
jgi:hypothetical protein